MEKQNNLMQYLLLAAMAAFIIVGIANHGATTQGYSTRYDVTVWECAWDNGWKWVGERPDYTWKLGTLLSQTEAYCEDGSWSCSGAVQECGPETEGKLCTCVR